MIVVALDTIEKEYWYLDKSYDYYVFQNVTCKKAGFPNVRVYLDGKTEDGKTIYKNEDSTPHQHKTRQQQPQQPQASSTIVTEPTLLKNINTKLDKIIALLESQK
jgi:hypothetical protein